LLESFARPLMIALACFAALDVMLVRFDHTKSMRMTREQVRLEMRDADGDPFIKAKLKRIREMRFRRRMMAKVKAAAVVVTNPTHYAVALSYDNTGAPRVVAKGADFVATRIREEATVHKVPIVANPPLARALYQVELDREIPAEHYRAVAEVIAFVWKLKTPRPASGTRL
jgi:flagellar biosynthetic protein FlhB